MIEYTVKVYKSGTKEWYLDGKPHREDGPAVEWADGTKFWYLNGKRHREDGPAVILANGCKEWFLNGKLHRVDGPAVEGSDGVKEWWLDGNKIAEQDVIGKSLVGKTVTIDGVEYTLGE